MLYQLHWQYKDGRTDMKAQRDIHSRDEMKAFVDEMWQKNPPPKGVIWMACDERSPHFWMMEAKDDVQQDL